MLFFFGYLSLLLRVKEKDTQTRKRKTRLNDTSYQGLSPRPPQDQGRFGNVVSDYSSQFFPSCFLFFPPISFLLPRNQKKRNWHRNICKKQYYLIIKHIIFFCNIIYDINTDEEKRGKRHGT